MWLKTEVANHWFTLPNIQALFVLTPSILRYWAPLSSSKQLGASSQERPFFLIPCQDVPVSTIDASVGRPGRSTRCAVFFGCRSKVVAERRFRPDLIFACVSFRTLRLCDMLQSLSACIQHQQSTSWMGMLGKHHLCMDNIASCNRI